MVHAEPSFNNFFL